MAPIGRMPAGLRQIHKDCLRLAAQHYSSKEIARMLDISKHTVDQRLRHATHELGANSRFEAARLFAEMEAKEPSSALCDRILYDTPHISPDAPDAMHAVSGGGRDQPSGTGQPKLQDAQAPYIFGDVSNFQGLFSSSVSSGETKPVSLGLPAKSLVITAIATVSLLAFGAAVAALEVLSRI